jgi:hypothetical protein
MKADQESFQAYLRGEVDAAGVRYDAAIDDVFRILNRNDGGNNPELLHAVRDASEDLRLYCGALRRMAHFLAGR